MPADISSAFGQSLAVSSSHRAGNGCADAIDAQRHTPVTPARTLASFIRDLLDVTMLHSPRSERRRGTNMSTTQVLSVGFAILATTMVGVTGVHTSGGGNPPAVAVAVTPTISAAWSPAPKGPEAGVWVIAETARPGHASSSRSSSPTTGAAIVHAGSAEGELQRLGARLRAGGFAEGEGHARQDAEPDRRRRRRARRRRRSTIRPATGSRCCRCRPRASSRAPGRGGNGIAPNIKSQGEWIRN